MSLPQSIFGQALASHLVDVNVFSIFNWPLLFVHFISCDFVVDFFFLSSY